MAYQKLKEDNLAEESLSTFAGAATTQLTAETVLDLCERFKRGESAGIEGGLGGLPAIARGARSDFILQKELEPETTEALALASTKSGDNKIIDAIMFMLWSPDGRYLIITRERRKGSSKRDEPGGKQAEQYIEVFEVGLQSVGEGIPGDGFMPEFTFKHRVRAEWTPNVTTTGQCFTDKQGEWFALVVDAKALLVTRMDDITERGSLRRHGITELQHEIRRVTFSAAATIAVAQNEGFVDVYMLPTVARSRAPSYEHGVLPGTSPMTSS